MFVGKEEPIYDEIASFLQKKTFTFIQQPCVSLSPGNIVFQG